MTSYKRKYSIPVFILLLIGVSIMIFPFIWMVLSMFKNQADVNTYPPRWIPTTFNFENFNTVFRMIPFLRYYANSIFTSVAGTALDVVVATMTAYVLVKLSFPGRNKLYLLIQSSMFVPIIVTMIPLYLIVSSLGMVDTYAGIILPQVMPAFNIMLMCGFFMSIPEEMIEAAKIDGCGYYRILIELIVPNSKTIISTCAMFSFLGHWRNYTWPLIITNTTDMRTLPIGLKYLVQESSTDYQVMMAASFMAIIPILIAYLLMEKQFVQSITLTGIKS